MVKWWKFKYSSDANLAGTQTQAIAFCWNSPAGYHANTESYDGSSFSEVNDLNNARAISAGVDLTPLLYVIQEQHWSNNGTLGQFKLKVGMEQLD